MYVHVCGSFAAHLSFPGQERHGPCELELVDVTQLLTPLVHRQPPLRHQVQLVTLLHSIHTYIHTVYVSEWILCINKCVCMYVCIYINLWIFVCMYVCILDLCMHMYFNMYVCVCINYMYICMNLFLSIDMYVCMYASYRRPCQWTLFYRLVLLRFSLRWTSGERSPRASCLWTQTPTEILTSVHRSHWRHPFHPR